MKKVRKVVWTHRALRDLEAIGDYIAQDDARAASRWIQKLIHAAEKAALSPLSGRSVPEIARDNIREALLRTYRIVYRVSPTLVEILTVFEGHKLFPSED